MKIVACVGLVGLCFCAALNPSVSWAAPVDAPQQAVEEAKEPIPISRDNFVSLSWRQTGGFAGITTTADVQGNVISRSTPRLRAEGGEGNARNASQPETRGLSNNQLNELIEKINEANLPALVGNYRQEGLMDGFNEALTLTVSDKDNHSQKFAITNYGGTAPKGYLDFVAFFREFVDDKFAEPATAE